MDGSKLIFGVGSLRRKRTNPGYVRLRNSAQILVVESRWVLHNVYLILIGVKLRWILDEFWLGVQSSRYPIRIHLARCWLLSEESCAMGDSPTRLTFILPLSLKFVYLVDTLTEMRFFFLNLLSIFVSGTFRRYQADLYLLACSPSLTLEDPILTQHYEVFLLFILR